MGQNTSNTLNYIVGKFNLPPLEGRQKTYTIKGTRDETLTGLFHELGFTKGAEIGVERAVYSKTLCARLPGLTLYGVDPWKAYSGYREHVSQEKLDGFYEEAIVRMRHYDFRILRSFSEEAHKYIGDEKLDFVYIDGNHSFLNLTMDIHFWSPKVRKGGIIAGHDFKRNSGSYVNDTKDVVPAYAYAKKIKPWFILDDHKSANSWFWVK